MQQYNPLKHPVPEKWLNLDEQRRIDLIEEYHKRKKIQIPGLKAHSALHAAVENQLAMRIEPVTSTLARLMKEGLDRPEAIHAISALLMGDIYQLLNNQGKPDPEEYNRRLNTLTAEKWRKGIY